MKLLEDWSALVSTDCQCYYIDEDTGEYIYPECGECGEWMTEGTLELIEEWLERNDYPSAVIIEGRRMGWRNLSGYALIREAGSDKIARAILDKLMLNGDFTLEFTLKGKACTVRRGSHDEPTGAHFKLQPFTACDGWSECQAVEGITEHEGQNLCAWCLDMELANN